jgi:hypothetical protein
MIERCTDQWGVPPNFFVVDYYNIGSPQPGSVLRAVAKANGVVYRKDCCGRGGAISGGQRRVNSPFGSYFSSPMAWTMGVGVVGSAVMGGFLGAF